MASFIEFPIFTGVSGDLRPWISWLETFFVREKFKKLEKMNLAQSLLEGEAEAWFYLIQETLIFYSWRELKEKLLLRFGDVADSDRIRLINEQDRFLMEIRDEARIRRRKTTSIPEKDSIWETEPEALVPKDTIPVTNRIESRDSILATKSVQEANSDSMEKDESHEATMVKVEGNTTINQVPVSSLEPSLSFSSEPLDVSASWPCAIVSNNPVHSQSGFESVTNMNNAYQVFDKTSPHTERLKPKTKKKLSSLSLKTWKFKFKNKNLQRNWSQMDLHQVIDRSKVNHLLCFSANFGLVRNRRTFQCLRLTKQAHKSRVLYQLRWLHDPGGKKDEHFDEIFEIGVDIGKVQRTQMDIVAESVITAPDNVAPSKLLLHSSFDGNKLPQSHKLKVDKIELQLAQSDITLVGLKVEIASLLEVNCVLADCLMHKATVISATLYSLFSFEVDIEANMSSGLSPTSQVWEPGGVVAANVLVDWLLLLEFVLFKSWCGWLVFDRGKKGQLQWPEIQTISWYKEMVAARFGFLSVLSLTHAVHLDVKQDFMRNQALTQSHRFKVDKFGRLNNTRVTVVRVLCLLGTLFGSTSVKKQKFGKNWWYKFKHSLWQRECGRDLLLSAAILAVRFDVIGRRELLLQWQNRDESEHSWMLAVEVGVAATVVDVDLMSLWRFSKAFVHLSPSYKLEDKLGLEGVSIDTLHHAYRRKKRMTAQQVFKSKERVKGKTLFLSEGLPLKSQELI